MQSREDFIEGLIRRYERSIAPVMFVFGFIFDTLTLRRIDVWFDHIILITYLLIASTGIVIVNAYQSGRLRMQPFDSFVPFLPIAVQFAFGGFFSIFVIFYTKSGAIGQSWLFLLVLCVLLVGNEHFRKQYQHLVFQLSIFFVVLFSYSIFALPILTKQIGIAIFVLSGLASLVLLGLFVLILRAIIPREFRQSRKALGISIAIIYLCFHLFYFLNIIPPIPLSIKESGIYHSVTKIEEGYRVEFEPAAWYEFFRGTSGLYHWRDGERIYFFSSVFAPTELTVKIFHHWFYYDDTKRRWIDRGSILISMIGGRDGGYRGYSFVTSVKPGKWRVEVTTFEGQIVGRETFRVEESSNAGERETTVK